MLFGALIKRVILEGEGFFLGEYPIKMRDGHIFSGKYLPIVYPKHILGHTKNCAEMCNTFYNCGVPEWLTTKS